LFFFANRRCVKEELKTVAKILGPDIPVKVDRESKPLKEFLNGMREETLRWNLFTTPGTSPKKRSWKEQKSTSSQILWQPSSSYASCQARWHQFAFRCVAVAFTTMFMNVIAAALWPRVRAAMDRASGVMVGPLEVEFVGLRDGYEKEWDYDEALY